MRLTVENLACQRGSRVIFSGLSFTLSAGDALVLTGPNGSGKTTLLRTLAGLMQPAGGSIRMEVAETPVEQGEQCHYVGHRDGVRSSLTVAENATFWAQYLDGEPDAAEAALDRLGIGGLADIPAGYLSAGQRRRLGLARLLIARRPMWLLDEPTTSLDAAAQATVGELMTAQLASGGILVAATHAPLGLTSARELRMGQEAAA